ncbi:hypothetical protein APHAL10511_008190 [Amanita phalloides]|nr:hypothetical protein APHAL10511_008190 [Amanita phalloides]
MAPRLRSTRRREREVLNAGPVNVRGLPALPAELLREIVSHTTTAPIPYSTHRAIPVECLERNTTLRTLSQLCRSLRNALLPVLWERIEACTTTTVGIITSGLRQPRWFKDIATDLVAQLETVTIREPSLATYVRTVNVLITPFSADTVLAELARCLALMPNLHTVQITNFHRYISTTSDRRHYGRGVSITELYRDAFLGYRFPSVQRIVLPLSAKVLLPCFPEARIVYMNEQSPRVLWDDRSYCGLQIYVEELASHCQKVESFAWNGDDSTPPTVKSRVYQMLPGLRRVRMSSAHETPESISSL